MISRLRKKFISITAAALFAMILLVIAAINCVYIYQSGKTLESRLDQIMDGHAFGDGTALENTDGDREKLWDKDRDFPPRQLPPQNPNQDGHVLPDNSGAGFRPFDMKLAIHLDGCLILLDGQGNLKELRQNAPAHYSEEELLALAQEIQQGKSHKGWHQYFRYRLETLTLPDGTTETKIGLINASADLYSVFTMLVISVSIGILSFLLVLFIIILASGRAVKPVAESYERQKQFVTDAGHELKTPLTVISANNELARMLYGSSEWFDGIDNQVAKMNSLIRNLITLARLDEEQSPDYALFNFSDAVYDTAKSFERLIRSGGRLITFDIAEEIFCFGDESRLRQAVAILMDNAAKYCDEQGKIAVKLSQEKHIRLQVINDYSAVANLELDRVFERFYRGDKARTPDGSYGLGLSIAKSIVEQHKGELQAKALEHGRILFQVCLRKQAASDGSSGLSGPS